MGLVKSDLKSDIASFLSDDPPSASASAFSTSLFEAYESYAGDAEDISMDKPLGFTATPAATSSLAAVMDGINIKGTTNASAALTLGKALGNSLETFWTGVLFGLTKPLSPMNKELTAAVTVPGLVPSAAISLLEATEDFDIAASVWADAMDTFAKTVQVTITGMMPGPSGPVPAPPITGPIT